MTEYRNHGFAFAVTFRFPTEACQKMSKQTIVAFYGVRFGLGLPVFF
jgi:hypothetical protein